MGQLAAALCLLNIRRNKVENEFDKRRKDFCLSPSTQGQKINKGLRDRLFFLFFS